MFWVHEDSTRLPSQSKHVHVPCSSRPSLRTIDTLRPTVACTTAAAGCDAQDSFVPAASFAATVSAFKLGWRGWADMSPTAVLQRRRARERRAKGDEKASRAKEQAA